MSQIAIDIAWNLGLWEKLGTQGSVALAEMIEETGADSVVLGKHTHIVTQKHFAVADQFTSPNFPPTHGSWTSR